MTRDKVVEAARASRDRDSLGRRVREVWVEWAKRQPNPKPSWLVSYDELSEADKEADRCIGAALWGDSFADGINATDTVAPLYAAPTRAALERVARRAWSMGYSAGCAGVDTKEADITRAVEAWKEGE